MIKKGVPVSPQEKKRPRNAWPFKEMKVGDVIDVELKGEWKEASKYAHMFANKKGWKFTTIWLDKEDVGRIRRTK